MNSKLEYELNEQIESPSFTKIQMKAMKIWRKCEEDTEMFDMVKELIDTIEEEQIKAQDLKGLMYVIAGKM